MALTHKRLLEEWREKSERGQAEARRVIAEMLTPSGGSRTNCYKFISWVTGRSLTTIGKVNDQMKKTGLCLSVAILHKIDREIGESLSDVNANLLKTWHGSGSAQNDESCQTLRDI